MTNENDELEEQCEDAVFQICCTRERYSVRCANQLEKSLALTTKKNIAHVQKALAPNFDTPVITDEQQELFRKFDDLIVSKVHQSSSKSDVKTILNRIKDLKSIVNQIERSRNSEIHQLLEE